MPVPGAMARSRLSMKVKPARLDHGVDVGVRANEDVLQIWGLSNEMMAFPFTLYTEGRRS